MPKNLQLGSPAQTDIADELRHGYGLVTEAGLSAQANETKENPGRADLFFKFTVGELKAGLEILARIVGLPVVQFDSGYGHERLEAIQGKPGFIGSLPSHRDISASRPTFHVAHQDRRIWLDVTLREGRDGGSVLILAKRNQEHDQSQGRRRRLGLIFIGRWIGELRQSLCGKGSRQFSLTSA